MFFLKIRKKLSSKMKIFINYLNSFFTYQIIYFWAIYLIFYWLLVFFLILTINFIFIISNIFLSTNSKILQYFIIAIIFLILILTLKKIQHFLKTKSLNAIYESFFGNNPAWYLYPTWYNRKKLRFYTRKIIY